MCAAIGPDASVVIITPRTGRFLTQNVRAMCGVPAAMMLHPAPRLVAQVVRGIEAAGRMPVLLAHTRGEFVPYRGVISPALMLRTRQDPHELTAPPAGALPLRVTVWMLRPAR